LLILPLHKKPTRENFPLVTLVLLVANVMVFSFLQSGDTSVERDAASHYIESGVLADEWAWFGQWVEHRSVRASPEEIDGWFGEVGQNPEGDQVRLMVIDSEPDFINAVENGEFVAVGSLEFRQWRSARDQLHQDRQRSFTRSYMLRYDEINPVNAFTHMFMHAGVGHLVGNMLFLALLGLLIEGALGGGRFLVFYLVSGLGAVVASLSLNWGADTGGIGASGAIAGMMGLYAVIYGMRKVRFFYWAFVYFDYVRAPALILLPLWLGWEVVAYTIDAGGNIAYEAHIGGLVCGALLGLLAVRTGQVREDFLNEDEHLEDDREAISKAQRELEKLNGAAAKRLLRPLLIRHDRQVRLWRLYFAACQLRVDDPDLHRVASRILKQPADTDEERQLVIDTFKQYRKATNDRLKMPVSQAVTLAGSLASWGELEGAQFLIDQMARSRQHVPGLAELCQAMAERMRMLKVDLDRADHYERLARALPESG